MLVLRPASGLGGTRIDELAFAPDGRSLAAPAGRGRAAMLWTTFTAGARAELLTVPDGGGPLHVAFAPDGRLFVGNDRLYAVQPATGGTQRVPTDAWHTLGFAVSPDGTRLVVTERTRYTNGVRLTCRPTDDFARHLWQLEFSAYTYHMPQVEPSAFVQAESTFDSTGGRWRTRLVRRSLDTGDELGFAPVGHLEGFAVSPDGATVAVRSLDSLSVFPFAVGGGQRKLWNESEKHFTDLAFHPSGRYLVATSNNETVKLYDTTTWDVVRTFTWNIGRMRSVALSPDGTLAAAGSDKGKVVVWDVDV